MSTCNVLPVRVLVAALAASSAACITSPPSDFGATAIAKREKLSVCPNGLIDNLEDGESQIVKQEEREGYWFTSADPEGSTILPKGDFKPDPGGQGGSKYAAHMHGKMARSGKALYVVLGFAFLNPKGNYDASKYKGISFWAKGPGKVRFQVPDVDTSPEGDKCTDCYNHFGVDLFLTDQWTRYTIPFDRLAMQPGWGDPAPEVDTKALFGLQWQFNTAGADYDIWVDDVEFVGCP
jgi:endoglucanase